jgi:hypothetical protein
VELAPLVGGVLAVVAVFLGLGVLTAGLALRRRYQKTGLVVVGMGGLTALYGAIYFVIIVVDIATR